jgi:hypothetical protein
MIRSLLLLLLSAKLVTAADVVVQPQVQAYTLIRATTNTEGFGYLWWVTGPEGFADSQVFDNGRGVVFTGPPGRYNIMLAVIKERGAEQGQAQVVIGPGPGPGPQPVVGQRLIVLLHESLDQTPATGTLISNMRQGTAEKYLKDKGHVFLALDESNGTFKSWRDAAGLAERPVLMITDKSATQMLYKATLEPSTTADNIIELIKRHGG